MGIELDRPKTVFDSLEKIFCPESNQTLSHFKFRGLKQKSTQSCDSYMSELRLAIVECHYPDIVQDELLKDQFIFGLVVKEIQDHLLGEIVVEDTSEKCLLESRKIESKIEQRKLLGIKAAVSYDSIHTNNRSRSKFRNQSKGRAKSSSSICNCKYCGKLHNKRNCPAYGKKFQKCGKENHFKAVCKSGNNRDHSKPRGKTGKKKFHEINESGEGAMDDLAEQVQSLFYNDVHFNLINSRMHTTLQCTTPDGWSSDQTFKVDTGADGNLMPISMFSKIFPKVSLDALSQTINKGVTLYAYNDTEIKQFGTCSARLSFRKRSQVCKFFVVEHETAIIGITDSEKLGLVSVNFDMVQNERHVKIISEVNEETFKQTIEKEYPDLFKGIGLMDGEISIKLKDGAVPHVEPIRHVPHAMQEPLKKELDKLVI